MQEKPHRDDSILWHVGLTKEEVSIIGYIEGHHSRKAGFASSLGVPEGRR